MFSTNYFIIIHIFNFLNKISSVSIEGPALTRYDPCNLGVIHFNKLTDGFWQGVVNFGLYKNLTDPISFSVTFQNRVKIYGASQNSTFYERDNWHRFDFQPQNGLQPQYSFFIQLDNNDTDDVPTVTKFILNNITLCNEDIKSSQTVESLNVTNDDHYQHVCGRRSLDHAELISLSTEAKAGDWPWHVAIFTKHAITGRRNYYCGGNIISRTAVVTAGHCVIQNGIKIEPERLVIVAGVNKHSDFEQVGRQEFIAENIVVHPSYYYMEATADLAIIKVKKFKFTEYVQPICIWGPVYDKTNLFGYQATVVGFGTTEDNEQSDVLRSTFIMVQNDTTCVDYNPKIYEPLLTEFTFCAGYGPSSATNPRNGDSGGGLVVPTMQLDHKISWFLRGVLSKCGVSPGDTICNPQFYVVYTDVGPHYGWIYHHSGLRFRNNIS